jgi:hypothetical protein
MSNSIKVVARFRPQNRTEIELGGQPIVKFETEDTCSLDVGGFQISYWDGDVYTDICCSQKRRLDPLRSIACLI